MLKFFNVPEVVKTVFHAAEGLRKMGRHQLIAELPLSVRLLMAAALSSSVSG